MELLGLLSLSLSLSLSVLKNEERKRERERELDCLRNIIYLRKRQTLSKSLSPRRDTISVEIFDVSTDDALLTNPSYLLIAIARNCCRDSFGDAKISFDSHSSSQRE